jgi:two-component system response regulator ResD
MLGDAVLVVEDDARIGELVCAYLRRDGYRSIWVRSGEEALAEFPRHAITLVVLDIGLPGIDGFQVALGIRARCPRARIVLTSSRDLADLGTDRVSACGAAGFVHKAALSRAALVAATA